MSMILMVYKIVQGGLFCERPCLWCSKAVLLDKGSGKVTTNTDNVNQAKLTD